MKRGKTYCEAKVTKEEITVNFYHDVSPLNPDYLSILMILDIQWAARIMIFKNC
jgi:hypothetical protein